MIDIYILGSLTGEALTTLVTLKFGNVQASEVHNSMRELHNDDNIVVVVDGSNGNRLLYLIK